jgi:two-component system, chemotaxis family, chemotaxis protein CheY
MKKILLVDDSEFMRAVLKNILKDQGYEILEIDDGEKAIEKFKVEKPDLVLLDIVMPKMDGVAVLHSLKDIDCEAKIIMISAVGQDSTIKECQDLGAKGFIVKPFDGTQVLEAVKKVLD